MLFTGGCNFNCLYCHNSQLIRPSEPWLDEKELLGEAGHIDMENNTAESPLGSFYTQDDMPTGEYVMKVTLYDKVGKGNIAHSEKIIIE